MSHSADTQKRYFVVFYYGDDDFRYGIADVFFKLLAYISRETAYGSLLIYSSQLSPSAKARLNDAGIDVIQLKQVGLKACAKPLFDSVRHIKPDVILTGAEHASLLTTLIWLLSGRHGKLFLSIHSPLFIRFENMWSRRESRLLKQAIKHIFPLATGVVAVSDFVKKDVLTLNPRIPAHRIYNPVTVDCNRQVKALDTRAVRLLVVCRLVPSKRVGDVIDLVATCQNIASLTIVGDGPSMESLQTQAVDRGVEHRVVFVGFVDEVEPYYEAADILVLPSAWEGFGNVVAQAMEYGCQVIVNRLSGAPWELLKHGELGFGYDASEANGLLDAYSDCLQRPKNVGAIQSRANDFSINDIGNEYCQLFGIGVK